MTERYVAADPYPWPYNGDLRPQNTALIIIDMQTDFCGIGGYVDRMGYDLSLTRAPIEPIKATLAAIRAAGFSCFHTREAIAPISPTSPANKRWRSRKIGAGIGDPGRAASHSGARRGRLGDHPDLAPHEGNRSSTSRAKGLVLRNPISSSCCACAGSITSC
jgi:hypothetical protein